MGFRTSVPDSVSAGLARSHFACRFGLNSVFTELNAIAQHGNYSLETLEQFRSQADVLSNKTLVYGLSSLYLQLGETQRAKQLLNNAGRASREMKRYFSVLRFSSNNDLPCPKLTSQEQNCLDYISAVLSSDELAIAKRILSCGSFSIVGNAPGNDPVTTIEDSCRIFFNNYRENPRINDLASIHVVTPSWKIESSLSSDYLCITGNSIFHRRSLVWQKFISAQHYKGIFTLPRLLWRDLSQELDSPPSAGALVIAHVAKALQAQKPDHHCNIRGYVAGISDGKPAVNHTYDRVQVSNRHNWPGEAKINERSINLLQNTCVDFVRQV